MMYICIIIEFFEDMCIELHRISLFSHPFCHDGFHHVDLNSFSLLCKMEDVHVQATYDVKPRGETIQLTVRRMTGEEISVQSELLGDALFFTKTNTRNNQQQYSNRDIPVESARHQDNMIPSKGVMTGRRTLQLARLIH